MSGGACAEQRVSRSRISAAARRVKVTARQFSGAHAAFRDQMRDAVRQRAGLAGARAGEDQQRTFDDLGGAALLGIERAEHGVVVLERGRVLGQE